MLLAEALVYFLEEKDLHTFAVIVFFSPKLVFSAINVAQND